MQSAFDWDINFDEWATLAATDPEAFERQRASLVSQVLDHSPERRQERLRGLQWRIDKVRERSATPLAACIRISGMMWDSVMGEGGLVESLQSLRKMEMPRVKRADATAQVLPFRPVADTPPALPE
ncbi:MAG: DUF3135 domain-containing protein [Gammaproteobacteria bacterium]|nr:MAG: DUF3135 domain-containing protein [Gammaproteobacteria bacterium]